MGEKKIFFSIGDGGHQRARDLADLLARTSNMEWPGWYALLREALEKNYRDIAKLLLINGCKVNSNNESSATPLHYAAANGAEEIVEMLLDRKAEIYAVDVIGQTPLHYASKKNQNRVVRLLLKAGACVDAKDIDGLTPLHVASKENCPDSVAILLSHKACINSMSYLTPRQGIPVGTLGYTPLHYAVENGHGEVTKLLLQNNASVHVQAQRGTPLHVAAENGNLQIINDLLNEGACVRTACISNRYMPLHNAFIGGNIKAIELLLCKGANVNAVVKDCLKPRYMDTVKEVPVTLPPKPDHYTLLHCATICKLKEVTELLIKQGADVNIGNEEGKTPIFYAIENLDVEITKMLLVHGAKKDTRALLNAALRKGSIEIVESILQFFSVADINVRDKSGGTALYHAVLDADDDITRLLLRRGANPRVRTGDGTTVLCAAVRRGRSSIVEILLDNKAEVNAEITGKTTPLHISVQNGNEIITELLLSRGAFVNAMNEEGSTPLHTAAHKGDEKIVQILLKHGADIECKTNEEPTPLPVAAEIKSRGDGTLPYIPAGRKEPLSYHDKHTALHVACLQRHEKVVEVLLKHGAKVDSGNESGMTPLHFAVLYENDNPRIAEILIRFGANIDRMDKCGNTPLLFAFEINNRNIVEVLLHNSADINKPVKLCNKLTNLCQSVVTNRLFSSGTHSLEGVARVFIRHVVKMRAENLSVNEKYLQLIHTSRTLKQCYSECRREIEETKNKKICDGDTIITFYDIITKGVQQVAVYARNVDIVEVLNSNEYKKTFPIYGDTIEYQFRKGQERECLFRSCTKSLNSLFGYGLPNHFTEKMLTYLTHLDLVNLIDACPDR